MPVLGGAKRWCAKCLDLRLEGSEKVYEMSMAEHRRLFGANRGPRPSTDSADGLASLTKMKAFWVIKYLNIYSTNK